MSPSEVQREKEWQAEYDANTLAEAQVIYSDPARLKKAQEKAKKMAEDQREKANAMQKVAGAKKTPQGSTGMGVSSTGKRRSGTGSGGSIKKSDNFNVFKKI